jgi:hypothetical protein
MAVVLDVEQTERLRQQVRDAFELADWEREAVRRGARLLDEVVIKWWERINIDKLECDSAKNDILGQVFGAYYIGLEALNIGNPSDYGYDSSVEATNPILDTSFRRLEGYWKAEIVERIHAC